MSPFTPCALYLLRGLRQRTPDSGWRGMNHMTPGRIPGRLAPVPVSGEAGWRAPVREQEGASRMLGSHRSLMSLSGRPAFALGRGGPGLIGTGSGVISEVVAVVTSVPLIFPACPCSPRPLVRPVPCTRAPPRALPLHPHLILSLHLWMALGSLPLPASQCPMSLFVKEAARKEHPLSFCCALSIFTLNSPELWDAAVIASS